jgi:hypothetical protein
MNQTGTTSVRSLRSAGSSVDEMQAPFEVIAPPSYERECTGESSASARTRRRTPTTADLCAGAEVSDVDFDDDRGHARGGGADLPVG